MIQHQEQIKLEVDKWQSNAHKRDSFEQLTARIRVNCYQIGKNKTKARPVHPYAKLKENICSVGISDQNSKHLVCTHKKEDAK